MSKGKVRVMCAAVYLLFLLLTGTADGAEGVIETNPGAEPVSVSEAMQMIDREEKSYLADTQAKQEYEKEISVLRGQKIETGPGQYFSLNGKTMTEDIWSLSHGGQTMRFLMKEKGSFGPGEKKPLYITLHGGGGDELPYKNNEQWANMFNYYDQSVTSGIYVACRGIQDTWNMHFLDEAYPLYDRLIEYMILCRNVDPNRVYLLGFSAGGDGVYQIAPRMADRFAAVNMSSGHPNGVLLKNLANCPISIQVGIRDYLSEDALRSVRGAAFNKTLNDYNSQYGFGYRHQVLVHVPEGHNFNDTSPELSMVLTNPDDFAQRAVPEKFLDVFLEIMEKIMGEEHTSTGELSYADAPTPLEEGEEAGEAGEEYKELRKTNALNSEILDAVTDQFELDAEAVNADAVSFVNQYVRDPAPARLVWDLSTRAAGRSTRSFYWLQADAGVNRGTIEASYDKAGNTITLKPDQDVNGDFTILFMPRLMDTSRPIRIVTPKGSWLVQAAPSEEVIRRSIRDRGDPELAYIASIRYSELKDPENAVPAEPEEKPEQEKMETPAQTGQDPENAVPAEPEEKPEIPAEAGQDPENAVPAEPEEKPEEPAEAGQDPENGVPAEPEEKPESSAEAEPLPKTADEGKPGIWLGMILGGLAVLLLSQRARNGKETQC